MLIPTHDQRSLTLEDFARIVWRHRWVILVIVLVITASSVVLTRREATSYRASASVIFDSQNLGTLLGGLPTGSQPLAAQAEIAHQPDFVGRVLAAAHVGGVSAGDVMARTSISTNAETNIMTFSVTDRVSQRAVRLSTEYAKQFTLLRRQLDSQSLRSIARLIEKRLAELQSSGEKGSALYNSLQGKLQLVQTADEFQSANVLVLNTSPGAQTLRPPVTRNALLALAIAIAVALGLVFLREALETRVRSANELCQQLGLPLLGRIPAWREWLVWRPQRTILKFPASASAEIYGMLRTSLEFTEFVRCAAVLNEGRVLVITSAVEGEGKSTIIANLALALVHVGRRVILVELDLRRPSLGRLFGFKARLGLTDVASGRVSLDRALVPVVLGKSPSGDDLSRNGHGETAGMLEVLTAGTTAPTHVGEFVASEAVSSIIGELRGRADIVLLDTPPLLQVADAMQLSAASDGIILVARIGIVRRPMLTELRRVLDSCLATKVGVVVVGTDWPGGSGYEHSDCYGPRLTRSPVVPEQLSEP